MDRDRSRNAAWATAMAVAVMALPAHAALEVTPYVSAKVEYDNNIFRQSDQDLAPEDDGEQSDTTHTYGAGLNLNWTFGPQNAYLNGGYSETHYRRFDDINYESYDFDGGVNWRPTPTFNGGLSGGRSRSLEDFSSRAVLDDGRSLVETDTLGINANQLVLSRYDIRSRYDLLRLRHSADSSRPGDRDDNTVGLGVVYVGGTQGTLGLDMTLTESDYIRRQPAPGLIEEAEQFTAQIVASWKPSPITSLDIRVGGTQRDNKGQLTENESGFIGSMNLSRIFSVKTNGYVGISRSLASADTQGEGSVTSTGVNTGLGWKATDFLSFDLNGYAQTEDYENSFLAGGGDREDKLKGAALKAAFTPRQWITLSTGVGWQDRSSNIEGAEFDTFSANAELRLLYPIR
jgi:hypothetical protein